MIQIRQLNGYIYPNPSVSIACALLVLIDIYIWPITTAIY